MSIATTFWLLDAVLYGLAAYAYFVEPRRLRLTRRTIYLPRLPEALEGLQIVHFADLHLKSEHHRLPQQLTQAAVEWTLALQPDLVCITGDLGQGSRFAPQAARLLAPLATLPAFVVMGNHDHDKILEAQYLGPPEERLSADEWRHIIAAAGLTVLENEATWLTCRGYPVCLVGVGDPAAGWDDLERALPEEDSSAATLRLLLVHSPDLLDDPRTDWADLVLCGHTHGGQLRLPGIGSPWAPVWRDRRRADGLFAIGRTIAHVTRGVCAGLPARFLCAPEICLLTLRRGEPQGLRQLPRWPQRARVATPAELTNR